MSSGEKKDRKPDWVHFSFGGHPPMLKRDENGHTTLCGKTANRIRATQILRGVTCPLCHEKLVEENWFCPIHGFLLDDDVTNEGNCAIC